MTQINQIKRGAQDAHYDLKTAYEIIDSGLIAQISFVENNQVNIIPMSYARMEDEIVFHGSNGSRLMRYLASGSAIAINITLIDGIVFARSLFNHSMNYRSVNIYGTGRKLITNEKYNALKQISDHIVAGRWDEAREPNQHELDATTVVAVKIDQFVAKISQDEADDKKEDLNLPYWAGKLPLELKPLPPVKNSNLDPAIPLAESIKKLSMIDNLHSIKRRK